MAVPPGGLPRDGPDGCVHRRAPGRRSRASAGPPAVAASMPPRRDPSRRGSAIATHSQEGHHAVRQSEAQPMGQVIHLVTPSTAYPDATAGLEPAESVLLLAIRWWVADHREGADPLPRLCAALGIAGPHDAAFAVDRLMSVITRTAKHPVAIHCPRCPNISGDEQHLLHATSLTQA